METIASARNLLIGHSIVGNESWQLSVPSLRLDKGRCYLLKGGNMSGKSTLLRCLAGQHPRSHITGHANGEDWHFVISPSVLSATDDPMFLEWSVADNIRVAAPAHDQANRRSREELDAYLGALNSRFGWRIRASDPLFKCSTGARAFIQLARAALHRPALYLIDEVTANLDDRKARHFIDSLVGLAETHRVTVVLVSHSQRDLEYVEQVAAPRVFGGKLLLLDLQGGAVCRQDPPPSPC